MLATASHTQLNAGWAVPYVHAATPCRSLRPSQPINPNVFWECLSGFSTLAAAACVGTLAAHRAATANALASAGLHYKGTLCSNNLQKHKNLGNSNRNQKYKRLTTRRPAQVGEGVNNALASMMDAVLPHEHGTVCVLAVQPNTVGFGAYASDLDRLRMALASDAFDVVCLELCQLRAEYYLLESVGLECLLDIASARATTGKGIGKEEAILKDGASQNEAFETQFLSALVSAAVGCEDNSNEPTSAKDAPSELKKLATLGIDEELLVQAQSDPALAEMLELSDWMQTLGPTKGRMVELAEVVAHVHKNRKSSEGNSSSKLLRPAVWLVDRDCQRNQPRVQWYTSAAKDLEVAMGNASAASEFAVDSTGRARAAQGIAMRFMGSDRVRRRVIVKERDEYIAGEVSLRMERAAAQSKGADQSDGEENRNSLSANGLRVLLVIGGVHLEGFIRHWFEGPPPPERIQELNDTMGMAAWQSPDVLTMTIKTRTSWQDALLTFEEFGAVPCFKGRELALTLETAVDRAVCAGEDEVAALESDSRFSKLVSHCKTELEPGSKYALRADAALAKLSAASAAIDE